MHGTVTLIPSQWAPETEPQKIEVIAPDAVLLYRAGYDLFVKVNEGEPLLRYKSWSLSYTPE
jgi:hypothetical protein